VTSWISTSPDNPVFLQASRAETFINSKAIEMLGLEKMNEPWIVRDGTGRATGVIAERRGRVRDAANFLDAANGARANSPADVIRASTIAMLNDLNKAGLTASGGRVSSSRELHRELKRMRFFCFNAAPAAAAPVPSRNSSRSFRR
jgi:predicted amidohydrolase YtcJ